MSRPNRRQIERVKKIIFVIALFFPIYAFSADPTFTLLTSVTSNGETSYNLSLKIIAAMTVLTVLPALLMAMTCFTRIIIVLSILRQALSIPNVPTNQVLLGITLVMTFFIMQPVLLQINNQAIQPYISETISGESALDKSSNILKEFMLKQTRRNDLKLFAKLAKKQTNDIASLPIYVVMPAFLTSEIKTAFQIGFLLYLPFLIIDLVVSSVLMSMGMVMLSPLIISLPFKIMLFVLANGWSLILGSLASSYH